MSSGTKASPPKGSNKTSKASAQRHAFRCTECLGKSLQWSGRCPNCQAWNSLVEEGELSTDGPTSAPVSLSDAARDVAVAHPTGVSELDRVLGGGLVAGSVTLLGGEPGIGKSTLILQLCQGVARAGTRCLIVSGEESASQIGRRANRLEIDEPLIDVLSETDAERVLAAIDAKSPGVVIVDSVQTLVVPTAGSAAGSVSQVREVAHLFTSLAKARDISVVLIGHVTKEGSLAGPRVLEHLVDTVLEFEGDRHGGLRFLRAVKHRFGSTDEVGVLSMASTGLEPVQDAGGFFLDDRHPGLPGAVVAPLVQGRRPMLVEVQSLVDPNTPLPQPRRVAQGIDASRFAVVVAVLTRRVQFSIYKADIFVSTVGGMKVSDPGADLAISVAVASAVCDKAVLPTDCVIGEVGLGGEVRKVPHIERRINEAARLGFKRAIVPAGSNLGPDCGMAVLEVSTVGDALSALGLVGSGKRGSTKAASDG